MLPPAIGCWSVRKYTPDGNRDDNVGRLFEAPQILITTAIAFLVSTTRELQCVFDPDSRAGNRFSIRNLFS
jgi:hypothetical protein